MAKTLTEAAISTKNARSKLPDGLHWRAIDASIHLGYRKAGRSGRWIVRRYLGGERYKREPLGAADDVADADGKECLSYDQAKAKAISLVETRRVQEIAAADGAPPTVADAIDRYLKIRETRETGQAGRSRKHDTFLRLRKHVLNHEALAATELHALSAKTLSDWRDGLARSVAQATVRRIVNDLKAALNGAGSEFSSRLPADFTNRVRIGLQSDTASSPIARDDQALSDREIRRLIEAAAAVDAADEWGGDLHRLIVVLAATGARFSQVARMRVADVQTSHGRLMVPVSLKGRGAKRSTHIAVRVGEDVLAALRPVVAGRRGAETLLLRWRKKQVAAEGDLPPRWVRDARGAWSAPTELTRPWRKVVEQAGLPADVVPYAFRHSSIVRQLRRSLPVQMVASLHDTSAAMIEAHYAAAIVSALDDLAAAAVIPLIEDGNSEKVVALRQG